MGPDLWGNYVINRAEDMDFSWTPANLSRRYVCCTVFLQQWALAESWFGYLGVYPMDDGSHSFLSSELSQFAAGGAPLSAYSVISGPRSGSLKALPNQYRLFLYFLEPVFGAGVTMRNVADSCFNTGRVWLGCSEQGITELRFENVAVATDDFDRVEEMLSRNDVRPPI